MEKQKTHLDELIEMMEASHNDPDNELTTLEQWLGIAKEFRHDVQDWKDFNIFVMDLEQILRANDNTSENWDDEYYETTNHNEKLITKNSLPFKPYACFHRYGHKKDYQTV